MYSVTMARIFAHRGLSGIAPENTLSAIKACCEHNVTWFETDVDILADGTPVLMHDTSLARTTNSAKTLYDITQEDLKNIDAGSWFNEKYRGEKIPTLAELIDLMNTEGLNANIEIKSNEQGAERSYQLLEAVIAELERLNPEREVLVSSFNHVLLNEFSRRSPRHKTAALFTEQMLQPDWLSVVQMLEVDAIHPEDSVMTEKLTQQMRDAGYDINVWTVNSRARANELVNWGVTGLFTDYAHLMSDFSS